MEYFDAASGVLAPILSSYRGTAIDFGAAILLTDSSDKPILSPNLQRAIRNNDVESVLKIIGDEENVLLRGKQSRLWNKFYNVVQLFLERRTNGLISNLINIPAPAVGTGKKKVITTLPGYKFREELISLIYGSASSEEWSKLMTLFGVNRTIESAIEDKKEIMFLVDYLPTIKRQMVPTKRKTRKRTNQYRLETDDEFLDRIKIEAPRAFKKFLCEKYHIRVAEC